MAILNITDQLNNQNKKSSWSILWFSNLNNNQNSDINKRRTFKSASTTSSDTDTNTLLANEAADNEAYEQQKNQNNLSNEEYARQQMMANRSRTVGNSDITADEIFHQAIEKVSQNPNAFNAEQKQKLLELWRQLWYYPWSAADQQATATAPAPVAWSRTVHPVNTNPLPYPNTADVSNYGWRYWQNSWNDYTRRVQWAGNAAFFTL